MKTTAVLRKDGHPFASKNNATTRMRNLGIEDSHTVETYGDGYAIFPKALNEERVTLQKGDYIATAGLSEDDYHNVARAFMAAGADKGEYPNWEWASDDSVLPNIGWFFGEFYHGNDELEGRQLTLSQILNATNAGMHTHYGVNLNDMESTINITEETESIHLTDRLEAARTNLESAQAEYDALLEEHKSAYPKLHGLSVQVDIPPEEWRAGDVLICFKGGHDFTKGQLYDVADDGEGVHDDDGDYRRIGIFRDQLKFHRRP